MPILTVNAGSSSVKFTCFGQSTDEVLAVGLVERIGQPGAMLHYSTLHGLERHEQTSLADTKEAVACLAARLTAPESGVLGSAADVSAVGHRVVHGGEKLNRSQIIDASVKQIIQEYFALAPLHNPPNFAGILAAEQAFPNAVQVGVFDTAFHNSISQKAFLYALPMEMYQKDKIRRYGFHGISHSYVSKAAARFMKLEAREVNLVTCHLGNGCSITAVQGGKSVDTSMGFTPLEGLVMGTRCGDLDPAIVLHLMKNRGFTLEQTNQLLNRQSGLLGLSGGRGSDLRDLSQAMEEGNLAARRAIEVFCHRIRKYIGAYMAVMGRVDGIVFTGGIGANSALVRSLALKGMEPLGIQIDQELNQSPSNRVRHVQAAAGRVKVLVIPTNEEKEMASQVLEVLEEAAE